MLAYCQEKRRSSQSTSCIFAYLICKFCELLREIPDLQFNERKRGKLAFNLTEFETFDQGELPWKQFLFFLT